MTSHILCRHSVTRHRLVTTDLVPVNPVWEGLDSSTGNVGAVRPTPAGTPKPVSAGEVGTRNAQTYSLPGPISGSHTIRIKQNVAMVTKPTRHEDIHNKVCNVNADPTQSGQGHTEQRACVYCERHRLQIKRDKSMSFSPQD
jgi:hypothetical protein